MKLHLVNVWRKCHICHQTINKLFITLREKVTFRLRTLPLYRTFERKVIETWLYAQNKRSWSVDVSFEHLAQKHPTGVSLGYRLQ